MLVVVGQGRGLEKGEGEEDEREKDEREEDERDEDEREGEREEGEREEGIGVDNGIVVGDNKDKVQSCKDRVEEPEQGFAT